MSDENVMEPYAPLMAIGAGYGPAAQIFPTPSFTTAAAWPSASRAIYVPLPIHERDTIIGCGIIVGTASGNMAIGIYDETGARIVQTGDIAVPAAGFNFVDLTDTVLDPGDYWIGLGVGNTTATFNAQANIGATLLNAASVYQMAAGYVSGTGLVATATYARATSLYLPGISAFFGSSPP